MSKLLKQTVYISDTKPHPKFLAILEDNNVKYKDTKIGLEEKEGYFLTEEQLKELLQEYTDRIVEKAEITYTEEKTWDFTKVDKQSITSQLEPFLKEIT